MRQPAATAVGTINDERTYVHATFFDKAHSVKKDSQQILSVSLSLPITIATRPL